MADRLAEKGLDRNEVIKVMAEAKRLDSVIKAMNRPAERKAVEGLSANILEESTCKSGDALLPNTSQDVGAG